MPVVCAPGPASCVKFTFNWTIHGLIYDPDKSIGVGARDLGVLLAVASLTKRPVDELISDLLLSIR